MFYFDEWRLVVTLLILLVLNQAAPPVVSVAAESHARLFFDASDVATLQAKASGSHQQIWAPILAYAKQQLGTTPPVVAPADGDLDTYRNFGNALIPLAFTCVVTQAENYCALAKRYLLTYAAWTQWGEADQRGLGLAHMLMGNALAYDWLYDKLTPTERAIVRTSLGDWAQKMYEASASPTYDEAWKNWWRKSYLQNHYWTCNSALGMAALALLNDDPRAQDWLAHVVSQMKRLQYILNGIGDGSWHESIGYQSYGLTMLLPFLVNLRKIEGTDLLPHTYLRNYVAWRLYNYLPNSIYPLLTYGDFDWNWDNGYEPQNLLRFVAHENGDGRAEWLSQKLIAADGVAGDIWSSPWYVFEFLYYDPMVKPQAPTNQETAHVFLDQESVIWRTGWDDQALVFGLKSGALGGRFAFNTFVQGVYPWDPPCAKTACQLNAGHDHHDTNGFYLYKAGHWLAPEAVGVGKYAAAFHNTLLIDGQDQYGPPNAQDFWSAPADFKGSDGFIAATAHTPNFAYIAANATRRYKNITGLQDVTRHVLFVQPSYFLLLDNLVANTPHVYTWVSHFGKDATFDGAWVRGEAGDGQVLGVGMIAPTAYATTTGLDGAPYVHIQSDVAVANTRFIDLLYPTEDAAWARKPTVTLLADTGQAAAIRVQLNDGRARTDDILFNYTAPLTRRLVSSFALDGNVAVISRDSQGRLAKLFTQGGTAVSAAQGTQALVTGVKQNEAFEAIYQGTTVTISGSSSQAIRLYAPDVQQVVSNGSARPFTRTGDYILFCAATCN